MQVFLSWSGSESHLVAQAFRDWLPNVVQTIIPFMSTEDIGKGGFWTYELMQALDRSVAGIAIISPGNLYSPWLNFEIGALASRLTEKKVCPVLLGMTKEDVKGPTSSLQLTETSQSEVSRLVAALNSMQDETNRLKPEVLARSIDKWWPDIAPVLEEAITKIKTEAASGPQQPVPNPQERTEELLEQLVGRLMRVEKRLQERPGSAISEEQLMGHLRDLQFRLDAEMAKNELIERQLRKDFASRESALLEELNRVSRERELASGLDSSYKRLS